MVDVGHRDRLRATFDDAPEAYERTRPVCPPQLFDDLVALTGLAEGASILEIGCGTGQATMPLAERGFEIVCVELGPQLADFARRKLAAFPKVRIVNAPFETWDAGGVLFEAVVAFNMFHWLDSEVRYAKPAQLLRRGGALVVVASQWVLPEDADPFWTEVQEDYDALRPTEGNRPPPHPDDVGDLSDEIEASGGFRNVALRRYRFDVTYTADEYLTLLGTSSWHRGLAVDDRHNLLERIRRRLEARPERTVKAPLLATLNVAQRL